MRRGLLPLGAAVWALAAVAGCTWRGGFVLDAGSDRRGDGSAGGGDGGPMSGPFDFVSVATRPGATSVDFMASLNRDGVIVFSLRDTALTAITTAAIVAEAEAGPGGEVVAAGSVTVGVGVESGALVEALAPDTAYVLYLSATSPSDGPLDDSRIRTLGFTTQPLMAKQTFQTTTEVPGTTVRYLVYVPESYWREPGNIYPTIVSLHGFGQVGDGTDGDFDAEMYGSQGFRPDGLHGMILDGLDMFGHEFIVLAPQCTSNVFSCGNRWSDGAVPHETLEHAKTVYRIDPKRVYATGLSFGGSGAYYYAINFPDDMAALAPIASGGMDLSTSVLCGIDHIPLRAYHVAQDANGATAPGNTISLVTRMNGAGTTCTPPVTALGFMYYSPNFDPDVDPVPYTPPYAPPTSPAANITYVESQDYDTWTTIGHGGWVEAYQDPGLYDFFLAHSQP